MPPLLVLVALCLPEKRFKFLSVNVTPGLTTKRRLLFPALMAITLVPPSMVTSLVMTNVFVIGMGVTPVITHPERNMILKKKPEQILQLAQMGCVIQITANSITGHWGDTSKKLCKWLLDREAVHVVASDAHDPSFRPPVLSGAREWLANEYGEELARVLVLDNPKAVVENQELPYFPASQTS